MSRFDRLFPLGVVNIVFGTLAVLGAVCLFVSSSALVEAVTRGVAGADEVAAVSSGVFAGAIIKLFSSLFLLATGIFQVMRKKAGAVCGVVYGSFGLLGLIVFLLIVLSAGLPGGNVSLAVMLPLFGSLLPLANIIVCAGALNADVPVKDNSEATAPRVSAGERPAYRPEPHRDSGNTAVYTENGPSVLIQIRVRGENMDPYTVQLIDHVKNKIKSRIGRNTDCDVSIPQDFTVSGEHCEIFMNQTGGVMIQDMNSTHGTYVLRGKNRVSATSPVQVFDGDRIQLGQYTVLTLTFRNMK